MKNNDGDDFGNIVFTNELKGMPPSPKLHKQLEQLRLMLDRDFKLSASGTKEASTQNTSSNCCLAATSTSQLKTRVIDLPFQWETMAAAIRGMQTQNTVSHTKHSLQTQECWDDTRVILPPLPRHFPMDLINLDLPMKDFEVTLRRISNANRTMSIQATYVHDPIAAKLITPEHIEMTMRFWISNDGEIFHIHIQRQSGDFLKANRYINKLVEAMTPDRPKNVLPWDRPLTNQDIQKIQKMFPPEKSQTKQRTWITFQQEEEGQAYAMTALRSIKEFFENGKVNLALEMLCSLVDLHHTMTATALPCAIQVLEPTSQVAIALREVVIEFEQQPTQASAAWNDVAFSRQRLHLVLTIVANALETIICLQPRQEQRLTVLRLLGLDKQSCTQESRYFDWLGLWKHYLMAAQQNLHFAWLSAKSLHLTGKACPQLREKWRFDSMVLLTIKGMETGSRQHSLLHSECEKLHKWLCQ